MKLLEEVKKDWIPRLEGKPEVPNADHEKIKKLSEKTLKVI